MSKRSSQSSPKERQYLVSSKIFNAFQPFFLTLLQ